MMRSVDMYRRVPADLLEGTKRGSFFSICAAVVMVVLFYSETKAFFTSKIVTELHLDNSDEPRVRVNFNITMLDLPCEFCSVDVVSFIGTEQNVTQHVNKWQLDEAGLKSRFHGRNKKQDDILFHDETVEATIEELHEDGEQAVNFDKTTLEFARNENRFLFVDYFASWCGHCIQLAPTWEAFAELMHETANETLNNLLEQHYPDGNHGFTEADFKEAIQLNKPVEVGKVDCVDNEQFCAESNIYAYPTLRLFVDGKFHSDYHGDRTIVAMTHYVHEVEDTLEKVEDFEDSENQLASTVEKAKERGTATHNKRLPHKSALKKKWNPSFPGCQISGYLNLDRTPGNFHILARSNNHDLVPSMTNVSHEVHELSFGESSIIRTVSNGKATVPDDLHNKLRPMDGNVYINYEEHTAYHHHLKVVATEFMYQLYRGTNIRLGKAYQILQTSQLSHYEKSDVPEAKFIYDLSPVAMKYTKSSRKWYDYLTSIMAIIGGTFVVMGMLESSVQVVTSKKRR